MCRRYHDEITLLDSIVSVQPLGIFYIQQERFKNTALPEPKRLLEIIERVMPKYSYLIFFHSLL